MPFPKKDFRPVKGAVERVAGPEGHRNDRFLSRFIRLITKQILIPKYKPPRRHPTPTPGRHKSQARTNNKTLILKYFLGRFAVTVQSFSRCYVFSFCGACHRRGGGGRSFPPVSGLERRRDAFRLPSEKPSSSIRGAVFPFERSFPEKRKKEPPPTPPKKKRKIRKFSAKISSLAYVCLKIQKKSVIYFADFFFHSPGRRLVTFFSPAGVSWSPRPLGPLPRSLIS